MSKRKTDGNDLITIFREGKIGENLGLTKREHFAALAMQGILANSEYLKSAVALKIKHEQFLEETSNSAVTYADALIAELNNERT